MYSERFFEKNNLSQGSDQIPEYLKCYLKRLKLNLVSASFLQKSACNRKYLIKLRVANKPRKLYLLETS
jgi:hypothetical protein